MSLSPPGPRSRRAGRAAPARSAPAGAAPQATAASPRPAARRGRPPAAPIAAATVARASGLPRAPGAACSQRSGGVPPTRPAATRAPARRPRAQPRPPPPCSCHLPPEATTRVKHIHWCGTRDLGVRERRDRKRHTKVARVPNERVGGVVRKKEFIRLVMIEVTQGGTAPPHLTRPTRDPLSHARRLLAKEPEWHEPARALGHNGLPCRACRKRRCLQHRQPHLVTRGTDVWLPRPKDRTNAAPSRKWSCRPRAEP
jgi:hypothetical protein